MSEYAPVCTKAELELLDDAEVVEGYLYGFNGGAEPGSNRSRSFWHGWRNGQVDGKHTGIDDAQMRLAREIVGRYHGLH
jgi:hypothetical protein